MVFVFNLVCIILNIFYLEKTLHVFQRKDYKILRYFHFFTKKHIFFMIFCVFFIVFQIFFKILCLNIFINLSILTIQSFTICNLIESNKTPLKYTPRLIRLYSISALFLFICLFTPFPVGLSSLLVYIIPPFSNAINLYDKIKNKKFINNASSKIKNSQTKIIAITGSNGKTSVKNIL